MKKIFSLSVVVFLAAFLLNFLFVFQIAAQDEFLAPPGIEAELIYIPYPADIVVDGNLSDWGNIEKFIIETGPYTTGDPENNGQFTFSICADLENIYVSMTMPDQNIIAGQHGTNFWNEDSFEFFLNLTENLDITQYIEGIVQVNVDATNLGGNDPSALSMSGTRFVEENNIVTGYAFYTDNGWGIEVAFSLEKYITPSHGLTIGLQFQANGATEADRDSKLVWSKYDVEDNSWQNPGLFGTGVFYEIGKPDIPEPAERDIPEIVEKVTVPLEDLPLLRVNQVGYYPDAQKTAILVTRGEDPLLWDLIDSEGNIVASGETEFIGYDSKSWDYLHRIDFSGFTNIGAGFILKVGSIESFPFDIAEDIYHQLKTDALHYYYYSRIGIPLEQEYAGEQYVRNAFYSSDSSVTPFAGTDSVGNVWPERDYTLDAGRGWMDAGDYGKYVVNGSITSWTLLNLYERNPENFADGSMKIPENGNGIPDILDEVKWEMDFMLGMQVPDGQPDAGMVHHKLHEPAWSSLPYVAPESTEDRFVYVPSTAATLDMAAAAAMFSRLIAPYDEESASRCIEAAEKAWLAANNNPVFTYGNIPGDGGGNYDDGSISDEMIWAASELFITTGKTEYLEVIENNMNPLRPNNLLLNNDFAMSWDSVGGLGMLSLFTSEDYLDKNIIQFIKDRIIESADIYVRQASLDKYSAPMVNYYWGSNSQILNKMIVIGYAYDISEDNIYLNTITTAMDYILGRNAVCKSFISGYGENPMNYPHHRWWGNNPASELPPPPPGAIAGGVNQEANDDGVNYFAGNVGPTKRYIDDAKSYSTNEVAINWNAPLVWVTSFMDEKNNNGSGVTIIRAGGNKMDYTMYINIAVAAAVLLLVIWLAVSPLLGKRNRK
ncbi:MAG TPA: glycoside hydrolase family 9 protein [Candidatus Humimicrobiaceae bacterium]